MNKKLQIGCLLCILLLPLAMATDISVDKFKVRFSSNSIRFTGNIYGGDTSAMVKPYCEHNGVRYTAPSEKYSLKGTNSKGVSFMISMPKGACGNGDRAFVKVDNYVSPYVNITRMPSSSPVVVVPVVVISENQKNLNDCNDAALTWYNEHNSTHNARFVYQIKLDQCQFNFDKAECELNTSMEYKNVPHEGFKCVEKHEHHEHR